MTESYLQVSRNGNILEIVFDKPKVNAICAASSRELACTGKMPEWRGFQGRHRGLCGIREPEWQGR